MLLLTKICTATFFRESGFFVTIFSKNEVILMYDNDEMMMNILDDDLFPLEKESDTEDSD